MSPERIDLLSMIVPQRKYKLGTIIADWDSLMAFTTGYGLSLLETKYKEFFYKIPEQPKIELTKKIGSDRIVNRKPKTIRGFLS